ncbi:Uncharacterized protein T310_0592 [Rasamsonia emersonii CBS 393.64]|uniref:Rieske domain-containing protein n=1 Tax=Rasamsonia emersonii (strain ATCC 16479 / CBS 393.64 / IMI 116815) TaxID=1408163 RepID=A0A0F4Z4F3_RASE3|nr:Uncharacterized protein T310_0592 [Rasamsonia emersonii CBS 393.64]KKA25414.1 Uncharacterized protein T310_0592 [Rasamsonia emersonii CBS 393.64]
MVELPSLSLFLVFLTGLAMVLGGHACTEHSVHHGLRIENADRSKNQPQSTTNSLPLLSRSRSFLTIGGLERMSSSSRNEQSSVSRFSKPGDYHSFELASFPFFLILGKDNVVRAFHNVCRHRAYTITKKESGSSMVLGCRYHGWSYNTRGALIKAPHFENVPGFDKSQNGLFEIHTAMSKDGLIFINMDANPTVSPPDFKSADAFTARQRLGIKSTWISGSTFEANFNWKAAVESRLFDLRIPEDQIPRSALTSIFRSIKNGSLETQQSELTLFPNSTLYRIPGTDLWYSICLLPSSEVHTRVRCDLYSVSPKVNTTAGRVLEKLDEIIRDRIKAVENEFTSSAGTSPSLNNFKRLNEENRGDYLSFLS